jgi:RNA recognition motif-containing protein
MNIYVGNLPKSTTNNELMTLFQQYGTVDQARVIHDRETGESRGFGFVEMPKNEEAEAAMEALNGHDLKGRALVVNEARERTPRRRPSFNRNGGGGGGNFRRGRE